MNYKSYGQFCALAFALDVVGERWSLLIIRELLTGPRRFKDLMDGLPGISTNLLAERLKFLEERGILLRRVLPPPAGSTVYELTSSGRELDNAVIELGRWGARFLPSSMECVAMPSVGTAGLAIKAFYRPEAAQAVNETYQIDFGAEQLQVQVRNGQLEVQQGEPQKPDAIFHTDMQSYMGLFSGQFSPAEAVARGLVRVEGDPEALERFLRICGVAQPSAPHETEPGELAGPSAGA